MQDHDRSYKQLFSHPVMVRDLLEGFVREDWLTQLDYASLERVPSTYVSSSLHERANDMVWRARWGDDSIYIYLQLEFQSTVDAFMAIRVLTYIGLLYENLIKSKAVRTGERLPAVIPIVLYNGAALWSAEHEVTPLIQTGPKALQIYRPQARYLLLDEARYHDSELSSMRNLAAAVFRLENSRTSVQIGEVLTALVEWLKDPEQDSLRRAFVIWTRRTILTRIPDAPVDEIHDLAEMRTMVVSLSHEWKAEARREGLAEGREEGRQQGRREGRQQGRQEGHRQGLQEGEVTLLLRQLRKRFGELPDWVRTRLNEATTEQLEHWGEELLQAESLDALFCGEGLHTDRTRL